MSEPEQKWDWEDAWIERARSLFAETAERFNLQYDWEETSPVEVSCRLPAQQGLDFDLCLSLQGDEFVVSGGQWYAILFPASDEYKWRLVTELIEGLITGEARLMLYRAIGWSRPYWTEVQLRIDDRWKSVSTGAGCAIPPIVRPTILRNGHRPEVGSFRPASGSGVVLLLIACVIYWILK